MNDASVVFVMPRQSVLIQNEFCRIHKNTFKSVKIGTVVQAPIYSVNLVLVLYVAPLGVLQYYRTLLQVPGTYCPD